MNHGAWLVWLFSAALFVVAEIFTSGFFIILFAAGAVVAAVLAYVGLGPAWQWGAFVVISAALVPLSRRLARRMTRAQSPGIGADRLVGQTGVVLQEVDNVANTGMVRVAREEWRASSADDQVLGVGTRVEVLRVEGAHLVVRKQQEGR
ncbi:MAG: NfeD family protein [bacterium]|jgi:membrane protein implicated in regulation of membrane protease activity|nr:NfeD family protein [candidate division KSB1 bacterium]MDH7558925.1 NfeD family protein [bacterium]